VASRFFGTEYHYPLLAVAEVGHEVRYHLDPATVRDRVRDADRIVLFVHGIIGDTGDMAGSLQRAGIPDRYDLVLTFDYENLNDPIGDTARGLKRRLEEVGLVAGSGKKVDIVAHSMGGLVSRWFIACTPAASQSCPT
jgi:triacylglycerol esterase/lipase EstA (alpha/beta hydrolase family)